MKTEQLIPLCRRYHAMLLHSDEQTIAIAVVDTPPAELMEALRFATQKRIDIECWSQEQMDKRLQAQEKQAQLAQNAGPENIAERVNQILEPGSASAGVRYSYRTHGNAFTHPPAGRWRPSRPAVAGPELAAPIIARLKVMASLDIAEHRLPQDGQFALNLGGRPLSFRIATLPCRYGEKLSCVFCIRLTRPWIWRPSDSPLPSWRLFARRLISRRVYCWSPARPEAVKR